MTQIQAKQALENTENVVICNRRSENRPHGGRLRPPVAEQN